MRRIFHRPLVVSWLAIASLLIVAAGTWAQSPLFPTVQNIRPNGGASPYANSYNGTLYLPPGAILQLTPGQPPQFRQLLLPPNGNYSNRPYRYPGTNGYSSGPNNYPATMGYGSSPYIRNYGGAGTGP